MACKEWSEPKCDGVDIPKAHLAAMQTCPVSADNCTASEAGEGVLHSVPQVRLMRD